MRMKILHQLFNLVIRLFSISALLMVTELLTIRPGSTLVLRDQPIPFDALVQTLSAKAAYFRVLKGVGAIVFALWFYPWFYTLPFVTPPTALDLQTWVPWAVGLAGLAVLLGHSRSIWLNFTGGKSAATGLGVLLALSWPVGLGAATVFGVALAIFRIVSVSSMLAALTAIALICGLEQPLPYRLLVIAGSIYVIVRHRANIQRLLAGTEPRLGQSSLEAKAASKTE